MAAIDSGRVAIVTGGARGIGLAIVHALLDQDVVDRVAIFDLLDDAVDDERITVHKCDVTDADSVRAAYAQVDAAPLVLVNNAGGDPGGGDPGRGLAGTDNGPFSDTELFRRMVDLNFTSAHVVTAVVGPDMANGASICNTSSIAGQMGTGLYAYGAAKAAIINWTMSMARVLGPKGIRVNAVAPGIIRTFLWEQMQPDVDQYKDMVAARTPLLTDQSPEDIANAVAFLSSARASSITGQTLAVDGGLTAGPPIFEM